MKVLKDAASGTHQQRPALQDNRIVSIRAANRTTISMVSDDMFSFMMNYLRIAIGRGDPTASKNAGWALSSPWLFRLSPKPQIL
jgi:hypothetical protein